MARKAAPTRLIAFLKGINVGGHRVTMDRLRDVFTAMEMHNVSTYIASGNVLFDAPATRDLGALEAEIGAALKQSLGYEVATFLRTPAEVAEIAAFRPFAAGDMEGPGHTIHVGFLREPAGEAGSQALLASRTAMDEFRVEGREFYWLCRGKTTESLVSWPKVARVVKLETTLRNMTMIRKLAVIAQSA